jgi:hypothetical protein
MTGWDRPWQTTLRTSAARENTFFALVRSNAKHCMWLCWTRMQNLWRAGGRERMDWTAHALCSMVGTRHGITVYPCFRCLQILDASLPGSHAAQALLHRICPELVAITASCETMRNRASRGARNPRPRVSATSQSPGLRSAVFLIHNVHNASVSLSSIWRSSIGLRGPG